MSNKELIDTLSKASENENNIELKMLLVMAAERIQKLNQLVLEMGWQISPERMGR